MRFFPINEISPVCDILFLLSVSYYDFDLNDLVLDAREFEDETEFL